MRAVVLETSDWYVNRSSLSSKLSWTRASNLAGWTRRADMEGFKELPAPAAPTTMMTAAQVQSGPPIEPLTRIVTYEPAEWETFVEEWVSVCLKPIYKSVLRTTGANDRGVDVAAFTDDKLLLGAWDNYQCKRYAGLVSPGDAWPEIGKILWHSFNGHYVSPRAYYFVAPRGTGTTLSQLLANPPKLKQALFAAWEKNVKNEITGTQSVELTGDFQKYADQFDYSIFKPASPRAMLEQYRQTPYFVGRFGGGLPARPIPSGPPEEIQDGESVYVGHLLAAYADHKKTPVSDYKALKTWKPLEEHFLRQRESYYHAESLRVFVRDHVEPGTFESLQDEVYHGVVDVCDATYVDGFECVKAVTQTAVGMPLDAHPLGASALVRDRRGICHQLANMNRLKWTK